jgi:hypothetical protein
MNPKRIRIKKNWEDIETTKWTQRGFQQALEQNQGNWSFFKIDYYYLFHRRLNLILTKFVFTSNKLQYILDKIPEKQIEKYKTRKN